MAPKPPFTLRACSRLHIFYFFIVVLLLWTTLLLLGSSSEGIMKTPAVLMAGVATTTSTVLAAAVTTSASSVPASVVSSVAAIETSAAAAVETSATVAQAQGTGPFYECPGYTASNVKTSESGLTADLTLAGDACNVFGDDLQDLVLNVEYQTDRRLHVQIYDRDEQVYQIPRSVLDPPQGGDVSESESDLKFTYVESPFSFAVVRADSGEAIFNTSGTSLIFESQYLGLRSSLPEDPYVYGFGEDSDRFRRNTTNMTRTLWSRDAGAAPPNTNLYGNHPFYVEHRAESGQTHGVFLFNSNGMEFKMNNTEEDGQYLEFNVLGGIVDLYFVAGPSPVEVSQQYSEIVGKSAMFSYWHFGFHQCKYGYNDAIRVAQVISNYSNADIPLETMWTDIDYMYRRKVFTLDLERFPLDMMQGIVQYLHERDQHYVVMVDPAVSNKDNDAFSRGEEQGIFIQRDDETYIGAVWPGPAAFPDWFNPGVQSWWDNEFQIFFDPENGVDIDALWIDMNEPSQFCPVPCANATQYSIDSGNPPEPPPIRTPDQYYPLPGWPAIFQPPNSTGASLKQRTVPSFSSFRPSAAFSYIKRQANTSATPHPGLPGRNLIDPPYRIRNEAGSLSNLTIDTDLRHSNGLFEYDTHNFYGSMMSTASRGALLARRPSRRPLVITRSTFAGAGAHVGHWLGDNVSSWSSYRESIYQILSFAALFQVPMVGADVCGFLENTTETLCARWATLGTFYPFFRNHAVDSAEDQEFYRWESVSRAARKMIGWRYRMLDYIYTALERQSRTGEPMLKPLFFAYPRDRAALDVDLQFLWGDAVLVSPVHEENATAVEAYFPDDRFYDLFTGEVLEGAGATVTFEDVDFESIPVHVRGGFIVPLRESSGYTTAETREKDFVLRVAPGRDGTARGELYLDDGDSLVQEDGGVTRAVFEFDGSVVRMTGEFGFETEWRVKAVEIMGGDEGGIRTVEVDRGLMEGFEVEV